MWTDIQNLLDEGHDTAAIVITESDRIRCPSYRKICPERRLFMGPSCSVAGACAECRSAIYGLVDCLPVTCAGVAARSGMASVLGRLPHRDARGGLAA
jgi:hypothetical protein